MIYDPSMLYLLPGSPWLPYSLVIVENNKKTLTASLIYFRLPRLAPDFAGHMNPRKLKRPIQFMP